MFKGYEDLAAFSEANLDAALKTGDAVRRGADDLRAAMVTLGKRAASGALTAAVAVRRCRGVADMIGVQSHLATSLLETTVDQTHRMARVHITTVGAAIKPLEERLAAGIVLLAQARAA